MLHEMLKSGTATQQLIRRMITPYPRGLASSPGSGISLALEEGLTSVSRPSRAMIPPRVQLSPHGPSCPTAEPHRLPPALRSLQ